MKKRTIALFLALALILTGISALAVPPPSRGPQEWVAAVTPNGLTAINLTTGYRKVIDMAGTSPLWSSGADSLAYLRDSDLWLADMKNGGRLTFVAPNVDTFVFDGNDLIYAQTTGGLGVYRRNTRAVTLCGDEYRYRYLRFSEVTGRLYAARWQQYTENSEPRERCNGIVEITRDGASKLILQAVPIEDYGFGVYPRVAGVSPDGSKVFIWYAAGGSLTADGVPFGFYDVKTQKVTILDDIIALTYSDNFDSLDESGDRLAFVQGGNRFETMDKTLGILDTAIGVFTALTGKDRVAQAVDASADGTKVLFAGAPEAGFDSPKGLLPDGSRIYEADIKTGKVTEMTSPSTGVGDTAPQTLSDGFTFVRVEGEKCVLMRSRNGKVTTVAALKNGGDYFYYGHLAVENLLAYGRR